MPRKAQSLRRIPVQDWPDVDRQAWHAARAPADLFDAPRRSTSWAPMSWEKAEKGYGQWLRWLTDTHPELLQLAPEARLTRDALRAWLEALAVRLAPMSQLSAVEDVLRAMHVITPNADLRDLHALHRSLRAQAYPSRDKRTRLVSADTLCRLGFDIMQDAETSTKDCERRRAVAFRDGLIIALLSQRPIRLKNLASLTLQHHVVFKAGTWHIVLERAETKNGRPYSAPVPDLIIAPFIRYLEHFRPILLSGQTGTYLPETKALWISQVGTPLEEGALSRRIALQTQWRLGKRIPPHWFRDAAATTIAIDAPTNIADAHQVLGHATPATTERHYIQANSVVASRKFQAMMLETVQSPDKCHRTTL